MVHNFLARSRYLVLLGVIGSFVIASVLFIYALFHSVEVAVEAANGTLYSKKLVLECIELVDLFLLGTVFYIIALGLYELFIDDRVPVPAWLEIHTLDDLKTKLQGVVVTVLAVLFLGQVVTWDGERNLLFSGGGIAAVIVALAYYGKAKGGHD